MNDKPHDYISVCQLIYMLSEHSEILPLMINLSAYKLYINSSLSIYTKTNTWGDSFCWCLITECCPFFWLCSGEYSLSSISQSSIGGPQMAEIQIYLIYSHLNTRRAANPHIWKARNKAFSVNQSILTALPACTICKQVLYEVTTLNDLIYVSTKFKTKGKSIIAIRAKSEHFTLHNTFHTLMDTIH